jgi:hypothetical protein
MDLTKSNLTFIHANLVTSDLGVTIKQHEELVLEAMVCSGDVDGGTRKTSMWITTYRAQRQSRLGGNDCQNCGGQPATTNIGIYAIRLGDLTGLHGDAMARFWFTSSKPSAHRIVSSRMSPQPQGMWIIA